MQHLALLQEGSGRRLLILCARRVAFGSYIKFGRGPVQFFYPGCGIRKLGTGEPGGTVPPFLTPEDSSLALFQKDQRRWHSITHHRKDGAQLRPCPLPEDSGYHKNSSGSTRSLSVSWTRVSPPLPYIEENWGTEESFCEVWSWVSITRSWTLRSKFNAVFH